MRKSLIITGAEGGNRTRTPLSEAQDFKSFRTHFLSLRKQLETRASAGFSAVLTLMYDAPNIANARCACHMFVTQAALACLGGAPTG